jgi:hypothetical protein
MGSNTYKQKIKINLKNHISIYMVYNQNMVKCSLGWSQRTPQIWNKNKNKNSFN